MGLNNIPVLELWFEDMAAKDLYLKDCMEWYAVFTPGPPAQVRYRLEPVDKFQYDPHPTQEQKELYAQSGWQYVETVWRFYYAFLATDPQAPELHTDPVTQSYALDRLVRRRGLEVLGPILASLALVCSYFFRIGLSAPFWFTVVNSNFSLLLLLFLLFLWWPFFYFWRFWGLFKLRRQLRRGIPFQRKRTTPWLRCVFLVTLVLELAALLLIGYLYLNIWTKDGDLAALVDFPLLTLQQVEQDPDLALEPMREFFPGTPYHGHIGSYVDYHWSDLAPEIYTVYQCADAPSSASLTIDYYHLRFSFIAAPLAHDLMERETAPDNRLYAQLSGWTPLELSHPNADLILGAKSSGIWLVCAVRGSRVVLAEYSGTASPQDCLDGIVAMVAG